ERVLDGDARLVVVAVSHPAAELGGAERSIVHAQVERVAVVVAARALVSQLGDELAGGLGARVRHSSISRPSKATSQPAARTLARSRESSTSTGLVLLTWV